MKKLIVLMGLLSMAVISCNKEEATVQKDQTVKFSFTSRAVTGLDGGRTKSAAEPAKLILTIADNAGTVVADRKELLLAKFGDSYLSLPLTLQTSGSTQYRLTEFLVADASGAIIYATPREGSALARLVSDPLDIDFVVTADDTTTLTPEVLEVDADANPADYGYTEFGFNIVKKITAIFSSFVKGAAGNELSASHVKIEGLTDDTSNESAVWTYEIDLDAKANLVTLKEAARYRITATKEGYRSWSQATALNEGDNVNIVLEKGADVYVAGHSYVNGIQVATYWKNQVAYPLSTVQSGAGDIIVVNGDVYVTGSEAGTETAFYWKNGEKVFLSDPGYTSGIAVVGSDVYVIGTQDLYKSQVANIDHIPVYWKNGVMTKLPLPTTTTTWRGSANGIAVVGPDVYISGYQMLPIYTGTEDYAVIWKNGEVISLPLPANTTGFKNSRALDLAVTDGHVYASGSIDNHPAYWMDGVPTLLPISKTSLSTEMDVVNGDVYIAGFQPDGTTGFRGKYWMNSQEYFIEPDANVNLYCVKVVDGHLYLAGDYRKPALGSGPHTANYWIDGERFACSDKTSYIFGMFVVQP